MGKIKKEIQGGFSGKVGNVVGGSWRGVDYIRCLPRRDKKAPTPKQLAQRAKFRLTVDFTTCLNPLFAVSFNSYANGKTAMNCAISYTLKNAITGSFPDFKIAYASVLVSHGELPNATEPVVNTSSGGRLRFSWADNSEVGIAKATDKVILVAYCEAINKSIYITGDEHRCALTAELNVAA